MDRFDLFRIFARVVETSSFTRAAATLSIPRSTVSTAIGVLEARLGARLLNRTTRTVSATQDGLLFYERCLRLIADVEEAEATFRRDGKRPAGKLHVDMPGRIGRLIVAPALPDFVTRYPEIKLQMGLTDRAVDLVGENIDCALRVGPLGNSELIARPIGMLPLINVASPAYLARHGIPQTPDDLKAHLAVRYASPSTGKVELWEWIEDGTLRSTPMQGPITVNSAEAYIACCLAGLGLIQIPAYDVKDHLRSSALVEVMPLHRAEPLPMTLLYPHRRHLSRRVRVFSDWLEPLLKAAIVDPGERTGPKK